MVHLNKFWMMEFTLSALHGLAHSPHVVLCLHHEKPSFAPEYMWHIPIYPTIIATVAFSKKKMLLIEIFLTIMVLSCHLETETNYQQGFLKAKRIWILSL